MKLPVGKPATPARWSAIPQGRTRRWGSADVSVQRGGVVRYSLAVCEPGIDSRSRRLLRLWRAWPWLGAAILVFALVVTAALLPAPLVFLVGAVCYATGFLIVGLATAPERARVRRIWATEPSEPATTEEVAACARLKALGNLMVEADEALATGALSAVEHTLVWSKVYTELSVGHPVRLRTLHPHGHH